jgi:hypothetical protein
MLAVAPGRTARCLHHELAVADARRDPVIADA